MREPPRLLKVGLRRQTHRRRYTPTGKRKGRKVITDYKWPQLKISNRWLERAGMEPGDTVALSSPKPGMLLVTVVLKKYKPGRRRVHCEDAAPGP